jgi:tRNA-Thr(GGU) m(6)t(6)A37 methyltransferase TsaA
VYRWSLAGDIDDRIDLRLCVIGRARTPWTLREDAPHQPPAAPDTKGVVEILPEYRAALADLASFRRIWLIFSFHRSGGWGPRVRPPRGGPKRGLFATRAPDRPSPLGITNVALDSVDLESGEVHVLGLDLLDDTPILDIKPYLPMLDAWPDAGHGWIEPYLEAGIEPKLKRPKKTEGGS